MAPRPCIARVSGAQPQLSLRSDVAQPERGLPTAMALSFFSPFPAGPIGPGISSFGQSIGNDVPAGSHWDFEVLDFLGPPVNIKLRHTFPVGPGAAPMPSFLLGDPTAGTMTQPSPASRSIQGDAVDYRASLFNGTTGLVVDQVQITGIWDASHDFWLRAQAAGTGGFSTSDRTNLNSVLAAVKTVLPAALPGGAQLAMSVIDLVRGPPRSLLQPFGSQLLSGRGTFSAQPPGALHSFGGTWSWFTVPGGYGKDDGALVEWHRRLAQFVVIREGAGNNTYIDVLEDSHYEGNFILWQFPNPTEIQYDIAPGVQVLWRWLV